MTRAMTAADAEGQRGVGDGGADASSASLALPNRKTYLTTLASVAFVSGLTIATVVTIRRGRRLHLEDLRAAAAATAGQTSGEAAILQRAQNVLNASAAEWPLSEAASKGPGTLFREMNRAIFDRRRIGIDASLESSGAPSALQQRKGPPQLVARGKAPKSSVFDAPASSSAPSVLMRSSGTQQKRQVEQPQQATTEDLSHSSVMQQLREMKMNSGESSGSREKVGFGEIPAVLALKALGMATVIVGAGAYLFVELACRVLGVSSMDELVEKLTAIRPIGERLNVVGDKIGKSARRTMNGLTYAYEDMDTSTSMTDDELRRVHLLSQENERLPLPVGEAVAQLEDAVGRGDAAAWMTIISQQLNAERMQDLQERQRRMDARAAEKAAQARSV